MKAIIYTNTKFGLLNGIITGNDDIKNIVNEYLLKGKAKLILKTDDTLIYRLKD